jgi:hypothetical protein
LRRSYSAHTKKAPKGTVVTIPGLSDLLKDIKTLEDHARAHHSREETRMVPLTREEADVVESYRRFLAQDYD